ncbi:MAG: amino acid deaminase/aldolase [Solirubrobacterales bacterium]|nr:amino acid deaminase/aldolase [Solirubrobacterales bacterium]
MPGRDPSRYARSPLSPPAETIDREALRARYDSVLAPVTPPFAFVDLDALARNAHRMREQAGGLPIRVATKSVRSTPLLRRILELDPGFRGVLCFTLPEALHLAERGFDDLLVAYPSVDRGAVARAARLAAEAPGRAPVLMVDDRPHLDLIEGAIGGGAAQMPVCLDVDLGWWPLGGRGARIGPRRSPVHDAARARRMAGEIEDRPGTRLAGLMAYEGQIAGVGDRIPGRPLRSAAIRAMQSASEREIGRRLPGVVAAVRAALAERGRELGFVNGGGTGSLARTAALGAVEELSAGSGFFAPALFDNYRALELEPAAFFCLPVVRRPVGGVATVLGGGYAASGPAGGDRLPEPYLPGGLRFDRQEGAGEVQTPLIGAAAYRLRIGDRVYLRHAKAGELCERFNSLHLLEGDRIVDEVATYRGEGKAFL